MKRTLASILAVFAVSAYAANVTWHKLGTIDEDENVVTGVQIPTVVADTKGASDLTVTVTPVIANSTTNSYKIKVAAPAGFDPTSLQEAIDDLCVSTQSLQTAVTTLGTTKADKATTLAGYGISDAKIENGTISIGGQSIKPLTSFNETDPTIKAWAKADNKPTYTASEVGAVPTTRKVNNKALSADISLTASDVGAIANTAVSGITWDATEIDGEISNLHETIVALKQLITALGGTPPAGN